MKVRRIAIAATALGLLVAGMFAAGSASAATVVRNCPGWQLRSIAIGETQWEPAPVAGSAVIDASTVKVVKSADGKTGTSMETGDVISLLQPLDITVHYSLSSDASFAAGAVRLFYYHTVNADTLNAAPTDFVAADANSGTLTIHATGHIGTLGMVYDASNSAAGSVTFSDLKVGDRAISFAPCPSPSPSQPGPTASVPPAPVPTPVTGTLPVAG